VQANAAHAGDTQDRDSDDQRHAKTMSSPRRAQPLLETLERSLAVAIDGLLACCGIR